MGAVIPFQDPENYRRVMQRIRGLISEDGGTLVILPNARKAMDADGLDENDVLNIVNTGRIRPGSHSKPSERWRFLIEGQSVDSGLARCVVEVNGSVVVVWVYLVKGIR